jgi:hypothetical protein
MVEEFGYEAEGGDMPAIGFPPNNNTSLDKGEESK